MQRAIRAVALSLGLAAVGLLATSLPAQAHEGTKVGKYLFTVGFGSEPTYLGVLNSVQLKLEDLAGKPVTDLGDSLQVEVTAAAGPGQSLKMSLEPAFQVGEFGTPGDYRAYFVPTNPGRYTFRFFGTIKGQRVDQKFTSVQDGFDEVTDTAAIQFPVKQPTGAQLAQRLDREIPRLQGELAASQAAQRQARDDASSARTLATMAIAVAAVCLLGSLAVAGLALRRRTTPSDAPVRERQRDATAIGVNDATHGSETEPRDRSRSDMTGQ